MCETVCAPTIIIIHTLSCKSFPAGVAAARNPAPLCMSTHRHAKPREQLRFLASAFRLISPLNSAPFLLPFFLPPPELSLLHPQSQRRRRRNTIPVEINLPISFLRFPFSEFPIPVFWLINFMREICEVAGLAIIHYRT